MLCDKGFGLEKILYQDQVGKTLNLQACNFSGKWHIIRVNRAWSVGLLVLPTIFVT